MRLMRYDDTTKTWKQLFIDTALDKLNNLSDLTDKKAARDNLELDKFYWNKDSLYYGTALNSINSICIIQSKDARFVTDTQIRTWNNKVDRPFVGTDTTGVVMTDGQLFYNPSTDTIKIFVDGKLRDVENNREVHGTASFAGSGNEVTIQHGLIDHAGNKIIPKFVGFSPITNPQGCLGETWYRKDDTNVYIGNTGSYVGKFEYMIYY